MDVFLELPGGYPGGSFICMGRAFVIVYGGFHMSCYMGIP